MNPSIDLNFGNTLPAPYKCGVQLTSSVAADRCHLNVKYLPSQELVSILQLPFPQDP